MSMSFPYMFPPIFIRELYVFNCYIMINSHVGRSNPRSLGTPKPSFHSVQNASVIPLSRGWLRTIFSYGIIGYILVIISIISSILVYWVYYNNQQILYIPLKYIGSYNPKLIIKQSRQPVWPPLSHLVEVQRHGCVDACSWAGLYQP
jgi:hypothetical protein